MPHLPFPSAATGGLKLGVYHNANMPPPPPTSATRASIFPIISSVPGHVSSSYHFTCFNFHLHIISYLPSMFHLHFTFPPPPPLSKCKRVTFHSFMNYKRRTTHEWLLLVLLSSAIKILHNPFPSHTSKHHVPLVPLWLPWDHAKLSTLPYLLLIDTFLLVLLVWSQRCSPDVCYSNYKWLDCDYSSILLVFKKIVEN